MASEEDVPPLEDMSELLKQVDTLREMKRSQQPQKTLQNGHDRIQDQSHKNTSSKQANSASDESNRTNVSDIKLDQCSGVKKTTQKSENVTVNSSSDKKQSGSGFGGMKKGFLFGGSSAKPKSSISDKSCIKDKQNSKSVGASDQTLEDIPFVKKNESAETKNLRFSEVTEAMAKTNEKLMNNKDWVTDDLLSKLEKNEKLTRRLQDPRFMQAIGDFQRNPQEALSKYGNSPDVQEFFQDFCGLMGEHFNKLADGQGGQGSSVPAPTSNQGPQVVTTPSNSGADISVRSSTNPKQATAQDEVRMQQILSDPDIRLVLMDPKIQELFEALRNNPDQAQRILQTSTGELKGKIQKLVEAGLLQFQK